MRTVPERAPAVIGVKSVKTSNGGVAYRCGSWTWIAIVYSSVWPSGAAFATSRAPMTVEPPGRLSTIVDSPGASLIFCAIARAWMSAWPPGGNGTTMRTCLPGIGNP